MKAALAFLDGITRIADMAASTYIIGKEDIKSDNLTVAGSGVRSFGDEYYPILYAVFPSFAK